MLTDYHLHLRPDEDGYARRSATSPPRTSSATCAAAAAAGIEELGVSEHVYRFRQALDLWRHPFWEEQARDDLDAYCEFVRGDAAAARDRVRLRPRRRGSHREPARGARLRLRRRLGPLRRRARGRPRGLGRLGGQRRPRRGLAPLLRRARRVRPLRPLRHPRPPRPGQGLGRRPAAARARPPPLLRAGGRGDRRERDRGRGLDRRPAQAGRRALPGARVRRDVRRGGRRLRALLRRPPARAGRLRLRPRASSSSASSGVEEICVFEGRERRLEPLGAARVGEDRAMSGRDRLRQPPLRRGPPPGPRRGRDRARARPRRPLRRRRPHPRGDRRAARRRRRRATSARSSPTTTSAGATPTRSTCCAPWSAPSPGAIVNIDATLVCEAAAARPAPGRDGADPRRGDLGPGQRQGDHATRAWAGSAAARESPA